MVIGVLVIAGTTIIHNYVNIEVASLILAIPTWITLVAMVVIFVHIFELMGNTKKI